MITIIAKFSVISGKEEQFIKAAIDVTRETRKERGCLSYKILRSEENSSAFTFVEEWLNDTAIEQHNNSKHFNKFVSQIEPLIDEKIQIDRFSKVPSIFF